MRKLITLFSLLVISLSVFSVNITSGTKLYMKPNSNWRQADARFAAYYYDSGGGNAWTDMAYVEDDGGYPVYEAIAPSGTWTNVIFVRMNPGTTTNNWTNKWSQTDNLTYDGTNNCFQIASGTWDKGGGTWSVYTPPVVLDPSVILEAPQQVFIDETITLIASSENVNDPVYSYYVKKPDESTFISASTPYQPDATGTYTFKVEVAEDGDPTILASAEKSVLVKTVPADIVIRGKKPSDWENEMHLFVYGTNSDGFKSMTKSGDWYVYTFTRQESVNIIFVNGNAWGDDANQTVDVTNVTVSTCYQVGGVNGTNKRAATQVDCPAYVVDFTNLKSYAFLDDNITLSASSEGVTDPVYTYSVKLPEASEFTATTSPYTPSATGVYTFKVEVAENGDATVLASAEKAVTVMTLPTPITITVKVPDSWENTHFWYWTTFDGLGGWVEPTLLTNTLEDGAKVYRYTFTRFDELNFLVADGNDWGAAPVQTMNTLDVQEKSCYLVDDNPDSETGKYGITKVACDMLLTSVEKTEQAPLTVRVHNKTIELNSEKQASVELYSITGQLIRSAQNVHSFTQKVNSGVYVLRIDGKARKVLVND